MPNTGGPFRYSFRLFRTIVAYVIVSLYVLVIGAPGVLLALLIRRTAFLFVLGRIGAQLLLGIVGIRYRVDGLGHVPRGGVVFCSNHQSLVDPPVLYLALGSRLRFLYKSELNKIPVFSHGLRIADFVPIDRRNRQQAVRAIERAAKLVNSGLSFLIFAEGTRSRTGELLPFKKGGFVMAILAEAPIVPIAISGAREAVVKGSRVINPVTVSVRIGAPVETRGLTFGDRDRLVADVRSRIEDLLAQGSVERSTGV